MPFIDPCAITDELGDAITDELGAELLDARCVAAAASSSGGVREPSWITRPKARQPHTQVYVSESHLVLLVVVTGRPSVATHAHKDLKPRFVCKRPEIRTAGKFTPCHARAYFPVIRTARPHTVRTFVHLNQMQRTLAREWVNERRAVATTIAFGIAKAEAQ